MSEPEHEHEDEHEDEPVSPETVIDAAEAEEHEEAAEEPAEEPAEASTAKSEKDVDKALKALERAATTYRNAVGRIMEEDAQGLLPCPRCNAPTLGLIFPPEVAQVDDETREAVLASMGLSREAAPPLRDAEGVEMCQRCDGYGQLVYPTRNEHVTTQMCPACQGNGYKTVEQRQENVYTFTPTTEAPATTASGDVSFSMPDSWGRPVGHQHYGVPPAQVGG